MEKSRRRQTFIDVAYEHCVFWVVCEGLIVCLSVCVQWQNKLLGRIDDCRRVYCRKAPINCILSGENLEIFVLSSTIVCVRRSMLQDVKETRFLLSALRSALHPFDHLSIECKHFEHFGRTFCSYFYFEKQVDICASLDK